MHPRKKHSQVNEGEKSVLGKHQEVNREEKNHASNENESGFNLRKLAPDRKPWNVVVMRSLLTRSPTSLNIRRHA